MTSNDVVFWCQIFLWVARFEVIPLRIRVQFHYFFFPLKGEAEAFQDKKEVKQLHTNPERNDLKRCTVLVPDFPSSSQLGPNLAQTWAELGSNLGQTLLIPNFGQTWAKLGMPHCRYGRAKLQLPSLTQVWVKLGSNLGAGAWLGAAPLPG